jgi:hypothetical protein
LRLGNSQNHIANSGKRRNFVKITGRRNALKRVCRGVVPKGETVGISHNAEVFRIKRHFYFLS